ncbi:exo-alpha-sialidase [Paenibacillus oceani]|uniref:Exo-alpha-sialidase n=1 Tax=Paenibacillus oceani TaxID=2772510 RepID=A0A927CAT9_9BACL|nr:exo-alpha-sialidase [Paenibacillus oceani]MBD2862866.1 exo-alpha-sialidase [Paenibacillus oceani]
MKTHEQVQHQCWSEEWRRTNPDIIVYLPKQPQGEDADNEHFLVFEAAYDGDLLAMWTRGEAEGGRNVHVALSRSKDGGATWGEPIILAGPREGEGNIASWGFPVVSRSGRIYCFFNRFTGVVDAHRQFTGLMECSYSDDNGYTWKKGGSVEVRRSRYDHPDPKVPSNWIVWQNPVRDTRGRQIIGFTRHESKVYWNRTKQLKCEWIRFDNIDDGPDPQQLKLTWLPEDEGELSVPSAGNPERSYAEEPSVVLLPDGRLFCVMRTTTGRIWYSVSSDDGATWRKPEVMRYSDNGEDVLQPVAPCPVYALQDGRFLLVYHNNDGSRVNEEGKSLPRTPAFIALGEYRAEAHQPIWFSEPKQFADSDGVAIGPSRRGLEQIPAPYRTEVATYTSLTEQNGNRILWYPDRKHFLLGRYITDQWLEELVVPATE